MQSKKHPNPHDAAVYRAYYCSYFYPRAPSFRQPSPEPPPLYDASVYRAYFPPRSLSLLSTDYQVSPCNLAKVNIPSQQVHLKALINSFNHVWDGMFDTKHMLMLSMFPLSDETNHEQFTSDLVSSVLRLQGLLDGLMILWHGPDSNITFYSRSFRDHKMDHIREQMLALKTVPGTSNESTHTELYADFWSIANLWKHYFPYTLLPKCKGTRLLHDVYVNLDETQESGPLMYDIFVPMYNLTRQLLEHASLLYAVDEYIEDDLTWNRRIYDTGSRHRVSSVA